MPYRHALIFLVLTACATSLVPPVKVAPRPETLVDCLARTGVRLYGASWCHWCHVQLNKFGSDAPKVSYTDCDPDATLTLAPACARAGVTLDDRLPMWIFPGSGRVSGVRDPNVIARIAGCPSTQEKKR